MLFNLFLATLLSHFLPPERSPHSLQIKTIIFILPQFSSFLTHIFFFFFLISSYPSGKSSPLCLLKLTPVNELCLSFSSPPIRPEYFNMWSEDTSIWNTFCLFKVLLFGLYFGITESGFLEWGPRICIFNQTLQVLLMRTSLKHYSWHSSSITVCFTI